MTPDVRDQRQVARALDRRAQLTLMPRAHAAQAAGQDLAVVGDEAAERAVVLVVDEADAASRRTGRLFCGRRMVYSSSSSSSSRARAARGQLFFGHRRSADFVLVQRDEIADDAFVELERALVLGQHRRLGGEPGDDVVAVLARADRVRELAASPVIDLDLASVVPSSPWKRSIFSLMAASSRVESKMYTASYWRGTCGNPPFGREPPPAGARREEGWML